MRCHFQAVYAEPFGGGMCCISLMYRSDASFAGGSSLPFAPSCDMLRHVRGGACTSKDQEKAPVLSAIVTG